MSSQIFDVFLSHNSRDKPAARDLADHLARFGIAAWLDERELVPGKPWQEALEEVVRTSRSAAVLVGKDGIGPWHNREMRACLSEFVDRELPVIPVLLPNASGIPELPIFLKQFMWVDLRNGITEEGLAQLKWGITGVRPNSAIRGLTTVATVPKSLRILGRLPLRYLLFLIPILLVALIAIVWFGFKHWPQRPVAIEQMELYVRRNGADDKLEAISLIANGQIQSAPNIDPLVNKDDFKILSRFSQPTHYYLLWFDTSGKVVLEQSSQSREQTMSYPTGESTYISVAQNDPPGVHLLLIVAGPYPYNKNDLLSRLQDVGAPPNQLPTALGQLRAGGELHSGGELPIVYLNKVIKRLPSNLQVTYAIFLPTKRD
jgi:TIR domain